MNPSGEKGSRPARLLHSLYELGFLPEQGDGVQPSATAKGSTLFALSGMCFFFLYYRAGTGYSSTAAWFAMVLGLFVLTRLAPAFHKQIRLPRWGRLLAALSAVGTAGAGIYFSADWLSGSYGTTQVAAWLDLPERLVALGISGVFGLCGFWFLYIFIARVYTALHPVLNRLFAGTGRRERLALGALVLALAVFAAVAFSSSRAFYATAENYDVIYTADSSYLVRGNTWLNLTYEENDLRQPLFAVFAAPFVGGAYALTQLLPDGSWLTAWVLNLPQLGLLVLGFYMLASLMSKTPAGRLAVTVSLCALYPSLLFSLMMEQYILSVFWLLLFVYMAAEELPGRGMALVAASGSLLTSAAMLPVMWRRDGERPVRRALGQSLAAAGLGAFWIVCCMRLDVILNFGRGAEQIGKFMGESIPLMQRLWQYLAFAAGCFVAPDAGMTPALGWPSWQLLPAESVTPDGVAVLAMCVVGLVVGRRDRLVQISGWWCLFSALLLLGLGWGTAENGLILYGLYFSWAFYVLFRRVLIPSGRWQTAVDWLLALALLALNIPGMSALLRFAAEYYPV